jgi:hypothetical protein
MPSFRSLVVFPVLGSVLLATGCSATGGGAFTPDAFSTPCSASTQTAGAATRRPDVSFGFIATTTGDLLTTFNGTVVDPCAGVRLTGGGKLDPVVTPPKAPPNVGGCMGGLASYTVGNQNSKAGSGGIFLLTVCDVGNLSAIVQPVTGETVNGDYVFVEVIDGPYAGYLASGTVTSGNILVRQ